MSKDYRLARRHDRFSAFIGGRFSGLCARCSHGFGLRLPAFATDVAAVLVVIYCKICERVTCAASLAFSSFFAAARRNNATLRSNLITYQHLAGDSGSEQSLRALVFVDYGYHVIDAIR